jgi:glycosyltransferase involved in cell wall biosynthesis
MSASEYKKIHLDNEISLSIIVPAFNEQNTIERILDKLRLLELKSIHSFEVILINDASTDNTEPLTLKYIKDNPNFDLTYLSHNINQGKGAALKTGFKHAKNDYIIVQDADLEYDPMEIDLLFKPVIYDQADVVYGSRFMGGKPHRILFFWHSIGNKILTFLDFLTKVDSMKA